MILEVPKTSTKTSDFKVICSNFTTILQKKVLGVISLYSWHKTGREEKSHAKSNVPRNKATKINHLWRFLLTSELPYGAMALDFRIVPRGKKFSIGYSELFTVTNFTIHFYGKCQVSILYTEQLGLLQLEILNVDMWHLHHRRWHTTSSCWIFVVKVNPLCLGTERFTRRRDDVFPACLIY